VPVVINYNIFNFFLIQACTYEFLLGIYSACSRAQNNWHVLYCIEAGKNDHNSAVDYMLNFT